MTKSKSGCGDRRRARRAGRRLRARRPRPRPSLFEKNAWLGGKAAVLHEGGFRFDMGPTILTVPRVLRRIFAEAGRNLEDYLDLVRLDPQWRCFFDDGTRSTSSRTSSAMADAHRPLRARHAAPATATALPGALRAAARHLGPLLLLEVGRGSVDMIDIRANLNPVDAARRAVAAHGHARSPARSAPRSRTTALAQMLDHFTQYVGSSPDGSPAVLCGIAHMQTAEGVWYPLGGTRAVPEALAKLAGELGVEFRTGIDDRRARSIESGAVTGVEHRGRRDASPSTPSCRTWTPSAPTASSSAARSAEHYDAQGLRAGLLRRRALPRPRPALRPPRPSRLRLLARPAGGVRLHLPQGRAGARPDLLPRRARRHRPERRAAGRRGALRSRPHAVPAPASRLEADAARPTGASSSTS